MNKQIRLTESELHYIVNEAVNTILQENMEDEGWLGGLSSLGSRFGNKAKQQTQKMGAQLGDMATNVKNYAQDKYQQASDAVGNKVNTMKNTYQAGSANQDAQKAIQNAVKALNQLKAADQKLTSMGQYSVIGKQVGQIDSLIQTLQGGGATSVGGRFQNRRNAWTK